MLTLTDSAAAEIAERFGRTATVVPHPGLVVPQPGVVRRPGLVGLHLKALRTNVLEPVDLVRTAAAAATAAGGRLRVDVHDTVDLADRLPQLRELAAAGALDLAVHPRFDDDELVRYLQTLSVSLLPYRFGTHSGWLEACRDVGTTVIAPELRPLRRPVVGGRQLRQRRGGTGWTTPPSRRPYASPWPARNRPRPTRSGDATSWPPSGPSMRRSMPSCAATEIGRPELVPCLIRSPSPT